MSDLHLKGDIQHCHRCGKTWTIISDEDFIEQSGYRFELRHVSLRSMQGKMGFNDFGTTRSFICPCKRRVSLFGGTVKPRHLPSPKPWRRFTTLEGEVSMREIGTLGVEIFIDDMSLTETFYAAFENALERAEHFGQHDRLAGRWKITIERTEL